MKAFPLHLGNSESRKTLEQKFIFQIGTLNPHGIEHPTNLFLFSRHHIPTSSVAPFSHVSHTEPTILPIALTKS